MISTQFLTRTLGMLSVLLLVGCYQPSNDTQSHQTERLASGDNDVEPWQIVLLTKSQTNPYYLMMEQGARKAADELGVTLVTLGTPNETHVPMQKNIIASSIDEGVDALVFVPANPTQLIHSLKKAQQKGLVLVNLDDQIETEQAQKAGFVPPPFIGINNQQATYELGLNVLDAYPNIEKAYIVAGASTSKVAAARSQGFRDALTQRGKQILGEQAADWQFVFAYELTNTIVDEHPDVDAIFCSNDAMAIGVVQRLKELERGDINVIGYDAIPEARTMVEQGDMVATLDQQSVQQGYLGVKTAVALLNGEQPQPVQWVHPEFILTNK